MNTFQNASSFLIEPSRTLAHTRGGAQVNVDSSMNEAELPFCVLVLFGVIKAERRVDGGALVHELDGATWVGADVTDGKHAVR